MSQESLVSERIAQLRAITNRRNALLKEFYTMLMHKQGIGSVLNVIGDEDVGMLAFLREMDLEVNPENGKIDRVLESVSFDYPIPTSMQTPSPSTSPTNLSPPSSHSGRANADYPPDPALQPHDLQLAEIARQDIDFPAGQSESLAGSYRPTQSTPDTTPMDVEQSTLVPPPSPPSISPFSPDRLASSGSLQPTSSPMAVDPSQTPKSPLKEYHLPSDQSLNEAPSMTDSSPIPGSRLANEVPIDSQQHSLQSISPQATLIQPHPSDFTVPSIQKPIFIPLPRSRRSEPSYSFETSLPTAPATSSTPPSSLQYHQFKPNYTLPPLKTLPVEFNRKGKLKQQRKRDKEREKSEGKKDKEKEDWYPMGLNRWAAVINANPVWNKVARATKCLSSREWAVAMTELRLINTVKRIDRLKHEGRWSFRQPKKQRGVGGLTKTHWDYLLDEVKWMRADFREERKWKLVLAYNLSTAVLEWHACKTHAERIAYGICVQWRKPQSELATARETPPLQKNPTDSMSVDSYSPTRPASAHSEPPKTPLIGLVSYTSEDDEDDEEVARQSVEDSLDPSVVIEDALDAILLQDDLGNDSQEIMPKKEDFEDFSALRNDTETTTPLALPESSAPSSTTASELVGLRATSSNPLMGTKPDNQPRGGDSGEGESSSTAKGARNPIYASAREKVAHSDDLFLNLDDIFAALPPVPGDSNPANSIPALDLSSIFPDLQPYGLLDVIPNTQNEGKKRSDRRSDKDDPNKRMEDTTYTRLYPTGKFMFTKPTLLGALQPSKYWKDGEWHPFEELPVTSDSEATLKLPEDVCNELFVGKTPVPPNNVFSQQMQTVLRENRKWGQDHPWTPSEDALLKQLIDKYPYNWSLIAECFNASRTTVPTDKRTALDCLERWKEKWAPDIRSKGLENLANADSPQPSTVGQMTTRGVKRLAATNSSSTNTSYPVGAEPRKRRRHQLLQDTMRRASRKRAETAQKAAANARKPPAIHDTHNQFNKMPKLTPAELSRMKTEKETREALDLQNARRRQEEMARQAMLRNAERLAQQNGPAPPLPPQIPAQGSAAPQQPQQAGAQPIQQAATPIQRVPTAQGITPMAQTRSPQVNISQQQRLAAAALNNGANRLSPPQGAHTQARLPGTSQNLSTQSQAQSVLPVIAQGYVARDSTSSPAHLSPPQTSATPTSVNSPRPPSAQSMLMQAAQVGQVPVNSVSRAANVNGHYYLPNVPAITQEQLSAIRMQMLQVTPV
uniref:Vacuolar import and degradation protein 21 n=1 Tax=Volvariella volvacea TaxID=36659 RepID=A0A2H4Z446_9AGAR|nr:putative homeodomain protein [Volvariella volvacea]